MKICYNIQEYYNNVKYYYNLIIFHYITFHNFYRLID